MRGRRTDWVPLMARPRLLDLEVERLYNRPPFLVFVSDVIGERLRCAAARLRADFGERYAAPHSPRR